MEQLLLLLLLLLPLPLVVSGSAPSEGAASYPPIGIGYIPKTLVINELVLDMDYKVINEILSYKPIKRNVNKKTTTSTGKPIAVQRAGTMNHSTTPNGEWT